MFQVVSYSTIIVVAQSSKETLTVVVGNFQFCLRRKRWTRIRDIIERRRANFNLQGGLCSWSYKYAETNASVCQNKASIYLLMCLYTTKRNIMLIDFGGYLAYNNFCKNKNTKQYILSKELREPKCLKLSKKT